MKVIVVGGGIGGLSTAIALRFAGHEVTILEKSLFHNEIGAAVHVPPNADRILRSWNYSPERAQFVLAKRVFYGNGQTMEIGYEGVFDEEEMEREYGAKFWFAHRVDLHAELKLLATRIEGEGMPVRIETGREVVGYDAENGIVTLANGEQRKGDLIVAADGIHSKAVKYVVGYDNPAERTGFGIFRFLLATEELMEEDTKGLMREHEGVTRIWYNDDKTVMVWYPCRSNKIQNLAILFPEREGLNAQEGWNFDARKEDFLHEARGFHPSLQPMLRKVKEVKLWPLLTRNILPSWHKGRLVVIGDAAHPMLPAQAQAGAQAISDGGALGVLFKDFEKTDVDSISQRLKMFENVRMNEASVMQMLSNHELDSLDAMREATQPYMPEGECVPLTRTEQLRYRFSRDIFKSCREEMERVEREEKA